jgi:hypothetical protein
MRALPTKLTVFARYCPDNRGADDASCASSRIGRDRKGAGGIEYFIGDCASGCSRHVAGDGASPYCHFTRTPQHLPNALNSTWRCQRRGCVHRHHRLTFRCDRRCNLRWYYTASIVSLACAPFQKTRRSRPFSTIANGSAIYHLSACKTILFQATADNGSDAAAMKLQFFRCTMAVNIFQLALFTAEAHHKSYPANLQVLHGRSP